MNNDDLAGRLVDCYVYQKSKLLQRAKVKSPLDARRLAAFIRPSMEQMARVVEDWDIPADIIMEAVFAYAVSKRHFDGPMATLLKSVKYLRNALSYYMGLPYEAIAELGCFKLFLEKMDEEHTKIKNAIGKVDLSMASSYPVTSRYLLALDRLDLISATYMAPHLLKVMEEDRKLRKWMEHRGVSYEKVAEQFNKLKDEL